MTSTNLDCTWEQKKCFDYEYDLLVMNNYPPDSCDEFIENIKMYDLFANKYLGQMLIHGHRPNHKEFIEKFVKCNLNVALNFDQDLLIKSLDPNFIEMFINYGFKFKPDFNPFSSLMSHAFDHTINVQAEENCINIMNILISHGYDLHQDNEAAMLMCQSYELNKYFLEHGCDIHARDDSHLCTLIMLNCQVVVIKLLLQHGANPNAQNGRPIHHSCNHCNYDYIKLLMEYGGSLMCDDDRFLRNLGQYDIWADEEQLLELIKLFAEAGSDIKNNGINLFKIVIVRRFYDAIKLLIEYGIDITQIEADMESNYPVNKMTPQIFKLLMNNGFSVETCVKLLDR